MSKRLLNGALEKTIRFFISLTTQTMSSCVPVLIWPQPSATRRQSGILWQRKRPSTFIFQTRFWWMILGFENELKDDLNRNTKCRVLGRKTVFWINRNVLFRCQFIVHKFVVHWQNMPSSLSLFQIQLDASTSSKRRLHPAWVGVEE